MNTKAPTIGLSYQELKRQILSDALYDDKDGSSYLDPMYSDKVSTEHLKELVDKVKARKEKERGTNEDN